MMEQKITVKCSFTASLIFDVSFFSARMNVGIVGISMYNERISNVNIDYLFSLFYASRYKLCWNNIEFFLSFMMQHQDHQYQIFREHETSISFCMRTHDSLASPECVRS